MELTATQIEAVKKGEPVRVLLPALGEDVVILRAQRFDEMYDFVQGLAWELGKALFGKTGSGRSDLSVNAEQIVRDKIHAAARHG